MSVAVTNLPQHVPLGASTVNRGASQHVPPPPEGASRPGAEFHFGGPFNIRT